MILRANFTDDEKVFEFLRKIMKNDIVILLPHPPSQKAKKTLKWEITILFNE